MESPNETRTKTDLEIVFYREYHGHLIPDLKRCLQVLNACGSRHAVYLVGDSTLDNKYWLPSQWKDALNGYEALFNRMKPDVAYWLNETLANENKQDFFCINAACEESTLADRRGSMLKQDIFVRDHLQEGDVLIVSVGGNDIAYRPSVCTIFNAFVMFYLQSKTSISSGSAYGSGHFKHLWNN